MSADRYSRLLEVQTLMARVSRDIGSVLDLDRVLQLVFDAVHELVPCDGVTIVLVDGDVLKIVATHPPIDRRRAGEPLFSRYVVARAETLCYADLAKDEIVVVPEAREQALAHGIRSFMCVPLVCLGESIGALTVFGHEPDLFDHEHVLLVEGLATQVAGTIESARRYRMVTELEMLKSDFITRVSHELRTPITIMSGFLSTLLANHDELGEATRRDMLERVDAATTRLSGLIDQLLMLSRLEAGVVAATIESVRVAAALDEVRRQSISPDMVSIEAPPDLRLVTDRSLLVRGLGFLVDNALKYAGACRIVAGEGVVAVVDDGPGIAADARSRLFERFTRGGADTTVAGMGIGLPIARTLLAAAGADLTIEDNGEDVGCRLVAQWV